MTLPPLREFNPPNIKANPNEETALPKLLAADNESKNRSRKWFLLVLLAAGFFLSIALATLFHRPLLTMVGNRLVYQSELTPSDVLVVLTGGGTTRLERAIELLKEGYAPKILMTLPENIPPEAAYRDLYQTEKTMCEALLNLHKIPPEQVAWSDSPFYSTYDESLFLRQWMTEHSCQSAIAVTGYFQSRRAQWSFERSFADSPISCQIAPAAEELYSVTEWWKSEEGWIAVQNEYIKNGYYRVKGWFGTP